MRILAVLLLFAARAAAAPTVAVTLDDLPFVGPLAPGDTRAAATERILAALTVRAVPVGVFVTCDRIGEGEEALIRRWQAAGAELGNHSTAHRAVDDLGPTAWAADVKACGARLEAIVGAGAVPWFRYPFLQRGRTPEARDAAAAAIAALGYRTAPVTIDTADW
ncbi:MAG: polysaccharide deacetylase family protein, partial [Myxococcales bacterium]|nr:polysaccharide deacetylase family protein [Myxococcales bacterium]